MYCNLSSVLSISSYLLLPILCRHVLYVSTFALKLCSTTQKLWSPLISKNRKIFFKTPKGPGVLQFELWHRGSSTEWLIHHTWWDSIHRRRVTLLMKQTLYPQATTAGLDNWLIYQSIKIKFQVVIQSLYTFLMHWERDFCVSFKRKYSMYIWTHFQKDTWKMAGLQNCELIHDTSAVLLRN